MRAANHVNYCLAAIVAAVISSIGAVSAAPVPSSTVAVRAAVPDQVSAVGYYYQDHGGAWVNGPVALGFAGGSVTPFYGLYPPYGPVVAHALPVLAPEPYYPSLYPYIRSTGRRYGRHPF